MDNRLSDVAPRVASACARFWSAVKSAWPTPMLDRSDRYRPEAHYMRGPAQNGGRSMTFLPTALDRPEPDRIVLSGLSATYQLPLDLFPRLMFMEFL